jgi:hypothetical protein
LVAVVVKERAARCRLLGSDQIITLRASRLWEVVSGAIVTVTPRKQWRYGGLPYLSGEVQWTRIDVKNLDLVPLGLEDMGMWDPEEEYWGEENEPIEEWARHRLSERQAKALGHILEHGNLTIQDFEGLCPDVNRRSLQRDLKVMVDIGLLVSEGEQTSSFTG